MTGRRHFSAAARSFSGLYARIFCPRAPRAGRPVLAYIAFLVLSVFPAWTQDAEKSADQEHEEWVLPNRDSVRRELHYAQALAPDLQTKMDLINRIMDSARSGGVSPEDAGAMRVLRYLAGEGTLRLTADRSSPANFPEARRASCEALGYIGGESSREILLSVLKVENESMVLSEAVVALGKITAEPDEEIIQVFLFLLEKKVLAAGGDNNLAAALLNTIDKLADSKNGVRSEELFRSLMRIPDSPLMQTVRRKAMLLIEKMKGF
jgi:HEAT repeat protein